jgi:hypothetical protein
MPYKLRKAPKKDLYWVVNKETGKKYSNEPLPLERAKAQMKALYASENKSGGAEPDELDKWLKPIMDMKKPKSSPGELKGCGTHRMSVLKKYKLEDKPYSLKELSVITHIPLKILRQVYNRGVGAYKTQPRSVRLKHSFVKNVDAPMSAKLSKEQWGLARVYSFIDGNPKHDNDLRSGAGFFGDMWRATKNVVSKVVGRVKDVAKGIRYDYSPSVRNLLSQIGDRPIVEMYVRRDPIQSLLNTALNFISRGKWNEVRQKYNYDELFHLGLEVVIKMSDNSETLGRYVIEKNEVINISPAKAFTDKTQIMRVPMTGGFTINTLLNGAKSVMGDKFFPYDPFHNNCQDFIMSILLGSGLATPSITEFVKQPLEKVIQELPSITGKIAKGITDLGGLVNVAIEGRGGLKPMPRFAKQLAKLGIKPETYLKEAQEKANELGLAGNHIGFSDDDKHKLQVPNEDGKIIRFGATGLGDHILYTLSRNPDADKHRKNYLARATKIKGDWKSDAYSPNSLAIGVLW